MAEAGTVNGHQVIVAIMLDGMSIRKQVSHGSIKFTGYLDSGNAVEVDDYGSMAKEAAIFMAVYINCHCKVPCGYFFSTKVVSVTFDGSNCQFIMAAEFGANCDSTKMKSSFQHPIDNDDDV